MLGFVLFLVLFVVDLRKNVLSPEDREVSKLVTFRETCLCDSPKEQLL